MKLSQLLFKNRSYTPLPFLVVMVIFAKPNVYSMTFGFLIAFIGELIRFWGVCYIGSESRTTGTVGGTQLLINGPFAYVRNPLYLGNILIYMGIGIMSNALFPYLLIIAFVFFIFQYYMIILEEEKYLESKFSEEYSEYRKNVRRFFPKLKPYSQNKNKFKLDFSRGMSSERRTLQGFTISIIILIIIWIFR